MSNSPITMAMRLSSKPNGIPLPQPARCPLLLPVQELRAHVQRARSPGPRRAHGWSFRARPLAGAQAGRNGQTCAPYPDNIPVLARWLDHAGAMIDGKSLAAPVFLRATVRPICRLRSTLSRSPPREILIRRLRRSKIELGSYPFKILSIYNAVSPKFRSISRPFWTMLDQL
jgi:hypothetical protein